MIRKPTAEWVRAYREKHECSLQEAKAAGLKLWRTETLTVLQMQVDVLGNTKTALSGLLAYLLESEK